MSFVRTVKNSDDLVNIINIPVELRSRKVEVIILPIANGEEYLIIKKKVRGVLSKYKNKTLQTEEVEAWHKAVVEKHEVS